MCGIVGRVNFEEARPVPEDHVRQMLAALRHRGPDEFGIYLDEQVALGSARLSIIDLTGGQQPIANEDETLWIVFNGEIFNYQELRPQLEARGHRFRTATDTEVLIHLYEDFGPDGLRFLNGQFAIAIWDTRDQSLFLARDRLGVRPLFYTLADDALIFGSEIKAILTDPSVRAEIDPVALDQIFTFWSTVSPRTAFRGILEVPPGHYLIVRQAKTRLHRYWQLSFPCQADDQEPQASQRSPEEYLDEFRNLLVDATRIRLRADVPVGAYLSGGLDSSVIAALVRKYASNHLDTFSIAFSDPNFDESAFQRQMAGFLGTNHQVVFVTPADIGRVFPEVIWHTETPIMRTSPAPMFLLSKHVHDHRFKVALTGEGADEFLAGYDIFKEAAVRRFWARNPNSKMRPRLLQRLYPDIPGLSGAGREFLAAFFRTGLTDVDSPHYSHAVRWRNNSRTRRFFSDDVVHAVQSEGRDSIGSLGYPPRFNEWGPLERSQYLESTIFLSQYLLSSQGDRVAMAHSVEGRYPFLDHRVVEFCMRLPSNLKLNGLKDKVLLRTLGRELLPDQIWRRPKRPYRAPIHRSFFHDGTPDYLQELLSPAQIKAAGLFRPLAVSRLVDKVRSGNPLGETDDMALAGIISTQLTHQQFVADFRKPPALSARDPIKRCFGKECARTS
jgi:asparagine synthase (glutamine-hydrolysing)